MTDLALYKANALQRRLHDLADRHRFLVAVCPRQHGKSSFVRTEAVYRASTEGAAVAIVAPFRVQAKDIHWDAIKLLAMDLPGSQPFETDLRVTCPGGGFVQLYGADHLDVRRGPAFHYLFFDEAAYIQEGVWSLVFRPMISATRGRAVFVSTPHGRNWFHKLFQEAERDPEWGRLHVTYRDFDILPPEEIASIQRAQSAEEFSQEYECAWNAVQVGAIYARELAAAEADGHVGDFPWDPGEQVWTASDIGVHDSTASLFVQPHNGALWVIDYEEQAGLGLPELVRMLRAKPYVYAEHLAPFDLGNVEFGSGESRVEAAQRLGIAFTIVPKQALADGLDMVRRRFPRLRFNRPTVERLLEALASYHRVWRQDLKAFSDKPEHDWSSHGADALRYFVTGYRDDDREDQRPRQRHAVMSWNPFGALGGRGGRW